MDLSFKEITIADRPLLERFIASAEDILSCEYAFANLFIWRKIYDTKWAQFKDSMIIRSGLDKTVLMPVGFSVPTPSELKDILYSCFGADKKASIVHVPGKYVDANPSLKDLFEIEYDEDFSDYIHSCSRLFELKGEKLAKKKNLVSQFKRNNPDYKCARLEPKDLGECFGLAEKWCLEKTCEQLEDINHEKSSMTEAFDNFIPLCIEGIGIRVAVKLAAFSVFSFTNPGTAVVHFEKYDRGIKGAAQIINWETARYLLDKCAYINREQDVGLEGLRKAKRSYDPDFLLKTFTLSAKQ